MTTNQQNSLFENLVAFPLIIVITLYMIASAFVPFLEVNSHVFTAIFTLSGGIPALTLFFKEKFSKYKPAECKQ